MLDWWSFYLCLLLFLGKGVKIRFICVAPFNKRRWVRPSLQSLPPCVESCWLFTYSIAAFVYVFLELSKFQQINLHVERSKSTTYVGFMEMDIGYRIGGIPQFRFILIRALAEPNFILEA